MRVFSSKEYLFNEGVNGVGYDRSLEGSAPLVAGGVIIQSLPTFPSSVGISG